MSAKQKVVRSRVDGGSFLMHGDPLFGTKPEYDGFALPTLLEEGWKVASVHMTASTGTGGEQHAAYFILEKSGY